MTEGNYAVVNGLSMYYEIHGTGKPLILIHGGFGLTAMFGELIPALAATRQVIAVDLQAHGRTADIDRPLSCERMGDDIAALITHLGYEQADLFGYSLGGGVALQTAIRHPQVVRKLILLSAPYKTEGWYPEVRASMGTLNAQDMIGTIMYQAYSSVAPRVQDWPLLVAKMRELLTGQSFDWTAGVAALKVPTQIILGDADNISPAHAVEMFGLLGGGKGDGGLGGRPASQLAILAGVDHYSIFMRADLLLPVILPFLDVSTASNISMPVSASTPESSSIPQVLRR
jgi:pimeloyl-ACP methyl ester carboxylesterase